MVPDLSGWRLERVPELPEDEERPLPPFPMSIALPRFWLTAGTR